MECASLLLLLTLRMSATATHARARVIVLLLSVGATEIAAELIRRQARAAAMAALATACNHLLLLSR